jgi:hypothetical protein
MKTCKICQSVIDEKGMKCCYCPTYQRNKPKSHSFLIVILGFLMLVSVSNIGGQFRIGNNRPAIVTIAAKDQGFQAANCGTWTKV